APILGGINVHVKPRRSGAMKILEVGRRLVRVHSAVDGAHLGAIQAWVFCPYILAEQFPAPSTQNHLGRMIDVSKAPLGVQRNKIISDALQNFGDPLLSLLSPQCRRAQQMSKPTD